MPEDNAPWLVVGLGNPGPEYAKHRHNVGFMVADLLAGRVGARFGRHRRAVAEVAEGRLGYGGPRVVLAKPMTFMNLSGGPVAGLAQFYKVPIEQLVVIHDELDVPWTQLRLKVGGGEGGHNGLRSIIDELESEAFSRLRVGIGDPVRDGRDHVLSKFAPDEVQRLDELLDAAADAVEAWARDGTSKASNRFNTFQLREADTDRLAAPDEVDGPPDANGVRRTKTGWRRVLQRKNDKADA